MADNVTLPGTGVPVATDDVAGNHIQRIRFDIGPEGTSTPLQADNAAAAGNPLPVGGKYNSSAPTYDNGDRVETQFDVNGNKKMTLATALAGEDLTNDLIGTIPKPKPVSTYSPSLYSEITQVTSANIKATTGNVLAIYCTNVNAAVRYFQLHNKATAPAAAEVPIYSFPIPAGSATVPSVLILGHEFWTMAGKNFATGIGWAISTTYGTFTAATASEHIAYVHYI